MKKAQHQEFLITIDRNNYDAHISLLIGKDINFNEICQEVCCLRFHHVHQGITLVLKYHTVFQHINIGKKLLQFSGNIQLGPPSHRRLHCDIQTRASFKSLNIQNQGKEQTANKINTLYLKSLIENWFSANFEK